MWSARRGGRNVRSMAGRAFGQHSRVSLQANALGVVVGVWRAELRVRRTVASFALQTAVAGRESKQREAGGRSVRVGSEGLIRGDTYRGPGGEHGGVDDLPAVRCRGTGVATLGGGLLQPAIAR